MYGTAVTVAVAVGWFVGLLLAVPLCLWVDRRSRR